MKRMMIRFWMPAAGFIGKYLFRFFVADGYKKSRPLYVSVNIIPKNAMP